MFEDGSDVLPYEYVVVVVEFEDDGVVGDDVFHEGTECLIVMGEAV